MIDSTISLAVSTNYVVLAAGELQIAGKNVAWECLRVGCWGENLGLRERMQQEIEKIALLRGSKLVPLVKY